MPPMKSGRKSKFSVVSPATRLVFYNPSIFETFLENYIDSHRFKIIQTIRQLAIFCLNDQTWILISNLS